MQTGSFYIKMKRNKVELLAPAGNSEGFYGAIHAGADAVYLGGAKFGARAYADNFTEEELVHCIRYAHIWGRKVYLTVNTLVKDSEWEELYEAIHPYYEAGLDGVIVQDIGVLLYIREQFPQLELHASTQMTLTGAYGAAYIKTLGVNRIVPARELSLSEIRHIKDETGLEIEAFIHGAMCYCYSGQCLFSSVLGGRSGNRGRCAQPCRLPYFVEDEDTNVRNAGISSDNGTEYYPLSLKDMCTITKLPELIEAGIDSFKIEGRMKKPEYAAGVTAIYRKYIDQYYTHPGKMPAITAEDMAALSKLYIRSELQDGYYHKQNGADMVTLKSPAYSGSDEALLKNIRSQYLEKKPFISIGIYADFRLGEVAQVTLICREFSVTVTGDPVQRANNHPITEENIKKQLSKLGDTVFTSGEIWVTLDSDAFYPLKALNELRRRAVESLEDKIIHSYGLSVGRKMNRANDESLSFDKPLSCDRPLSGGKPLSCDKEEGSGLPALNISLSTVVQCEALYELLRTGRIPARIYLNSDLAVGPDAIKVKQMISEYARFLEVFLALPPILRMQDEDYLKQVLAVAKTEAISGCMIRSLEGYAYLKAHGFQKKITADTGFYIWNQQTLRYWQDKLDTFSIPYELNAKEQSTLLQNRDKTQMKAEKVIYGYIPMMLTANCILKTMGKCRHHQYTETFAYLTDRYKKRFPVKADCGHCMNIIYNTVPLSLHKTCKKWEKSTTFRLDFTMESKSEMKEIMTFFYDLIFNDKKEASPPYKEYTTAHEKRGVE